MNRYLGYMAVALCALLSLASAEAQTIALGERTPRVKQAKWLDGKVPPKNEFTYIEFIHSASTSCRKSTEQIYKTISNFDNISFVLISHQKLADIDSWVLDYVGSKSGVIIEDSAIRTSFGVNYAPYAIILDSKRRALWFGNPQLLDLKTIENLTQK